MKLRTTLLLGMMGLLAGVVALTMGAVVNVIGKNARDQVQKDVGRGIDFTSEVLAERQGLLRSEVSVVAGEPRLKAVVATGDVDHATVLGVLSELADASHADLLLLTDADGRLRADVFAPDEEGHDMSGNPLVRGALKAGDAADVWTDDEHVYQVHAHRIAFGTHVVGVLVQGRAINDDVMQRLSRQTGTLNALVVNGKLIARGGPEALVATEQFAAKAINMPIGAAPAESQLQSEPVMAVARPLPGYKGEADIRFVIFESLADGLRPARELVNLLSGLAVATLIVALGLAILLARRLSRPVDSLATLAARLAGGELAARVEPAGPSEVRGLGESMNCMAEKLEVAAEALEAANRSLEQKVEQRTQELSTRNAAMKTILDNAGEGFLTLDRQGVMAPERSAIIRTWFGDSPDGAHIWDMVSSHDVNFAEMLEIGWDSLTDGFLPMDMCIEQLPRRITNGHRVLSLEYKAVLDAAQELEHMVVVVTDITAELERERLEAEQRETLEFFLQLMSNPSAVRNFLSETRALVDEIEQADPAVSKSILRNIHTVKGNCSLYGLKTIASRCHTIETRIADRGNTILAEDLSDVAEAFHIMESRIQPLIQKGSGAAITLTKEEYSTFLDGLTRAKVDQSLLEGASGWQHELVESRLSVLAEQAKGLATRRNKPGLDVIVEGNSVRLDKQVWAPFWSSLVHVVRNAVDHGIELPEERAASGKAPQGIITLGITHDQGRVTLAIKDDGRGIDWDKLAKKGEALGLPTETDAERVGLLFFDGLSSKDEPDELSGRGVGMSAVQGAVDRLRGSVEVKSEAGQGTTFLFTFDNVPVTMAPSSSAAA